MAATGHSFTQISTTLALPKNKMKSFIAAFYPEIPITPTDLPPASPALAQSHCSPSSPSTPLGLTQPDLHVPDLPCFVCELVVHSSPLYPKSLQLFLKHEDTQY